MRSNLKSFKIVAFVIVIAELIGIAALAVLHFTNIINLSSDLSGLQIFIIFAFLKIILWVSSSDKALKEPWQTISVLP